MIAGEESRERRERGGEERVRNGGKVKEEVGVKRREERK